MNFEKIVADLTEAGYTQTEIAQACGIKQPSVFAIANGETKLRSWYVGDALIKLHRKTMRRAARRNSCLLPAASDGGLTPSGD